MNHLRNKHILVGITGGIAAYKAAELVRRLQQDGANVRVIMTKAAAEFIAPLTLQALSGEPVHLDLLDTQAEAGMGHIELARWADVVMIAPASADFMARLAEGRADDLLTAVCLATPAPIALAPAMNQQMWKNLATQENCRVLQNRGIRLLGPESGSQACGDTGFGRLREVADLKNDLNALFPSGTLTGKRVVITAGPTREALDPVRYLSNHSSGKMGYALAQAAQEADASVCLISGPTHLTPLERVRVSYVTSALEMHEQAMKEAQDCDIFIAAAAVADYRPVETSREKIKKGSSNTLSIALVKNPDILAEVKSRHPDIFVVGFAAETESLLVHARAKLQRKKLDIIIANDVSQPSIGFNGEQNAVSVLSNLSPDIREFQPMNKTLLARQLLQLIVAEYRLSHTSR